MKKVNCPLECYVLHTEKSHFQRARTAPTKAKAAARVEGMRRPAAAPGLVVAAGVLVPVPGLVPVPVPVTVGAPVPVPVTVGAPVPVTEGTPVFEGAPVAVPVPLALALTPAKIIQSGHSIK